MFAVQRTITDVVAILHAVKRDLVDGLIGYRLRTAHRIRQPYHAQDTTARGRELAVGQRSTGMEGHRIVGLGRDIADPVTLARAVRIVVRGQHHAKRGAAVPFQFDRVERAGDRLLHHLRIVALQTRHDRLRFGVAHAAVELERLRVALRVDHQARVQETGEADAFLLHTVHGGQDDFAHYAGMQLRRDDRRGRIRAHTARVRALIAVEQPFVILA